SPNRKVVIIPKFEPDEVRMPGPATMRFRAQRERTERMNSNNNPPRSRYPRRRNRRDRDNRDSVEPQE
ncbi:MAG: hypothetical protein IJG39_01255, partial [Synergistaceae bacterium]|nr:hypothetical protein [Synergistaceae bacterium]